MQFIFADKRYDLEENSEQILVNLLKGESEFYFS